MYAASFKAEESGVHIFSLVSASKAMLRINDEVAIDCKSCEESLEVKAALERKEVPAHPGSRWRSEFGEGKEGS